MYALSIAYREERGILYLFLTPFIGWLIVFYRRNITRLFCPLLLPLLHCLPVKINCCSRISLSYLLY